MAPKPLFHKIIPKELSSAPSKMLAISPSALRQSDMMDLWPTVPPGSPNRPNRDGINAATYITEED